MSRKRTHKVRTHLMIDEDVNAKLRVLLLDPKSGRLRYGALNTLVNSLLRLFIEKLNRPEVDVVEMLNRLGVDMQAEFNTPEPAPNTELNTEETNPNA